MLIKDRSLPDDVLKVLRSKATEKPHTGIYTTQTGVGTYFCRACGLALFRADAKFTSSCGWPSFDAAITDAVLLQDDDDGRRVEIVCARCLGHLGHVFDGEGYTARNRRYCVNSISLDFVENTEALDTEEAIVAGGCFWGVQFYFDKLPGVLKTEVGYTGGKMKFPNYESVCSENTGHIEAVRVLYDPTLLTYAALIHYFFEIHNSSQSDGQGPDIGPQYQSAVFYFDAEQKEKTEQLKARLQAIGYVVATKIQPVQTFWRAEAIHQKYYVKTGGLPYCHTRRPIGI